MNEFKHNVVVFGLMIDCDRKRMKEMWNTGNYVLTYLNASGSWCVTDRPVWAKNIVYRLEKKKVKKSETKTVYLLRNRLTGETKLFWKLFFSGEYEIVSHKEVTFEWEE